MSITEHFSGILAPTPRVREPRTGKPRYGPLRNEEEMRTAWNKTDWNHMNILFTHFLLRMSRAR